LALFLMQWSAEDRRARAWEAAPGDALAPVEELRRTIESKPVQSILVAAAAGALVALLRRRG
jgi:hypothetical protein